jgi:hypothetical protein
MSPEPSRNRRRRVAGLRANREPERRLGPLEFLLLGLVALGVAITIAMAVIDPPA